MYQVPSVKQDKRLSIVGSEAKNPLPYTIDDFLCPNCKDYLSPYSRCFDCKQVIQFICYKCQWESNLINHNQCHKNVSVISNSMPNFKKRNYPVFDALKTKIDDLYHIPFQVIAPIFNLVH